MKRTPFAAILLPLAALFAPSHAHSLPQQDELLREIYQELLEITTTHSAGDFTQSARAMDERPKTGGHSSVPTQNNAIYHLADGLSRLGQFEFPFKLSDVTRAYFERRAALEAPAAPHIAADMRAILRLPPSPPDRDALARLYAERPYNNAAVRTTCVATMLEGGHAENALPQRAKAVVNCRILPGEKVADVQATLARVMADDQIKISTIDRTFEAPVPPLTPELLKAVEAITADMWPGIPVIPTMSSGATDGRFLNSAGIWTYGITGSFGYPEGSRAHGLNEKMPVKSLYDSHEFQYRLGKRLGG